MYPIPPDSQALFGKRREEEQERNREKKNTATGQKPEYQKEQDAAPVTSARC